MAPYASSTPLFAVVMEAYLHGVSTRKVDDLVRALGADTGTGKRGEPELRGPGRRAAEFRGRSLAEVTHLYVFLDAAYCKARVNGRVVSQAVVVAGGVTADGRREVLGMDVGDSVGQGVPMTGDGNTPGPPSRGSTWVMSITSCAWSAPQAGG